MVNKAQIYGVIRLQCWISTLTTVPVLLFTGQNAGFSLLLGCMVSLLGSLLYARIAFRGDWAAPAVLLRRHFAAEMVKLVMTLLMFAVLFVVFRALDALWLFAGYLAAASAYWFGLLFKFDGKK